VRMAKAGREGPACSTKTYGLQPDLLVIADKSLGAGLGGSWVAANPNVTARP